MHIHELFRHMPGIGPHVLEGHYSLKDYKSGEHILPGLWSNTIKPGASINMKMWPDFNMQPLVRFYRSPPFCPCPYDVADNVAQSRRTLRIQNMLSSIESRPFGGASSGFPPPAGMLRPPMPMPRFPPPPVFRGRTRTVSSISTVDEDELTQAEEEELTFVNFKEERERTENMTDTDMLVKYTQLQDVVGQEYIAEWDLGYSGYSSDDSSSYFSSSASHSIVD